MDSTSASRPHLSSLLVVLAMAGCAIVATVKEIAVPRQGWSEAWGPLVPHKTFPGDCSLCHVSERWDVIREDFLFDHAAETGHVLRGAHESAACLRCHNDFGPVAQYAARGCVGCHADPHRSKLTNDCTRCHGETDWRPRGLVA